MREYNKTNLKRCEILHKTVWRMVGNVRDGESRVICKCKQCGCSQKRSSWSRANKSRHTYNYTILSFSFSHTLFSMCNCLHNGTHFQIGTNCIAYTKRHHTHAHECARERAHARTLHPSFEYFDNGLLWVSCGNECASDE